ncbi:cytochrome P450 [Kitasatospora purpeofusca]|uniref:cytochrome P450 n=1 Tax=Kitasatospora purpeofusca TaxID=67352 RepID=UPI002255E272|nr:cytochrome P450 [Kitasatospora purpeofusca]MCX4753962.1 cytochrome P450 [Kitasatospora purpeofusca]WSR33424.1 cytochrome P450 [Kitasatospora purpeofusca]
MSGNARVADRATDRATDRTTPVPAAHRAARRRDRRVYLRSHPLLFALLAATRRRPVARLGRTVLVHDAEAYRTALTRIPLDRTAHGTTGGAAAELTSGGMLFDQEGAEHRSARRALAVELDASAVDRLRPSWQAVLAERLPVLANEDLELVSLARELAGVTAAALTGAAACPRALAGAAAEAAAAATRDHLPGPRPPGAARTAAARAAELAVLLPDPRDAMVAVAAVNTSVAALPRAAAWCADAGLWSSADAAGAPALAAELLRLTAPSPLLPRVAAAEAVLAGRRVRAGDRLVLVARHAAGAHRPAPAPGPAATQAVFGAGPHACPGAGVARALLAELLVALAPYRPVVVRARVDRRAALPGWAELTLRATRAPAPAGPCPTGPRPTDQRPTDQRPTEPRSTEAGPTQETRCG